MTVRFVESPPLVRPWPGASAEALGAAVRARNDEILGDVLENSIERSAELREQRLEREREQREAEEARARREQDRRNAIEQIERNDAEALAERTRQEARVAARREGDPWRATLLETRADRIEARALNAAAPEQALDTVG
ncbi:MAG: hypothetical protein AAGI53_03385 [Planctomycetota bacterium]